MWQLQDTERRKKLGIGEYAIRHGVGINFGIFLIEISRNKQAINKRFQKGILNVC